MSTILAPIDDAVAWIIRLLFGAFGPIFGASSGVTWVLTIVVLVVIMRLILLPLFIKQMHTQRAMTALTPKITELRKRYKNDREKLNQETMKLYQEAGVNPLMGCLPILLQMPIFFGLFSVLRYIAEWSPALDKGKPLYGLTVSMIHSAQSAKILGATIADKVLFTDGMHVPLEAKIVILFAVVISMTTTYLTVRQSMKRGMMPTGADSPMGQSQKLMAYVMPLFALTGLYWQFGLVLYWVTTNVWTLGQQYLILRRFPVGAAAAAGGGNLPIGGGRAKPATAAGLASSGRTGSGSGSGQGKPRPATGNSGKAPGPSGKSAGSGSQAGAPADVQDAVPGKAQDGAAAGAQDDSGKAQAAGTTKAQGGGTSRPSGAGTNKARPAGAGKGTSGTPGKAAGSGGGSGSPGANGKAGPGARTPGRAPASKAPQAGRSPGASKQAKAGTSGPRASGPGNGHSPAANDGPLRRFTRRFEPEPEPTVELEPEVRIVRNQPQRQSRSKRSGKR